MNPQKTPDFRATCVELKAQVQHLEKREKLLTDKNNELTQKLSSLYLVRKTDNGRHMLVEREQKPNELAIKLQRRLQIANQKIEQLENQMIGKEKCFEQAIRFQKKDNGRWKEKHGDAEKLIELKEKELEKSHGEKRSLEERVKALKEEVHALKDFKSFAITEEANKIKQTKLLVKAHQSQLKKERKIASNCKENMEQQIKEKNRLTDELKKQTKEGEIQRKSLCTLKKEVKKLRNDNTELSNFRQQQEALIFKLEGEIVEEKNNQTNETWNQHNIITTLKKELLHNSKIKTKLEEKERELTNVNNSKEQEIIDLKNRIAELEEENNEVVANRDLEHQKWLDAETKVGLQDTKIQKLQDQIKQKVGETNAMYDELVGMKEQHGLASSRLKSVKSKLEESRKVLDVCVTTADKERALAEKKMAEMAAEKEELEKELQRYKALLEEEYKAQEEKLKASQELLAAEEAMKEKMKEEEEEREQLIKKRMKLTLKHLKQSMRAPLPPIPNKPPSPSEDIPEVQVEIGYISRHARFPLFKKSNIQPKKMHKVSPLPPISRALQCRGIKSSLCPAPSTPQAHPASSHLPSRPASPKSRQSALSPTKSSSPTPSDEEKQNTPHPPRPTS